MLAAHDEDMLWLNSHTFPASAEVPGVPASAECPDVLSGVFPDLANVPGVPSLAPILDYNGDLLFPTDVYQTSGVSSPCCPGRILILCDDGDSLCPQCYNIFRQRRKPHHRRTVTDKNHVVTESLLCSRVPSVVPVSPPFESVPDLVDSAVVVESLLCSSVPSVVPVQPPFESDPNDLPSFADMLSRVRVFEYLVPSTYFADYFKAESP